MPFITDGVIVIAIEALAVTPVVDFGSQILATPCATVKFSAPPPLVLCSIALFWCPLQGSRQPHQSHYPKTASHNHISQTVHNHNKMC